MSVIALLASCGGSRSPGTTPEVTPLPADPEPVQDVLSGKAVKGIIIEGGVEITDANGNTVPVRIGGATRSDGTYVLRMDADTLASVTLPVVVQVNEGTAGTTICDVDRNIDGNENNDCLTNDGVTYVAFGEAYTLPAGFMMESVVAEAPEAGEAAVANVTPATHLQVALAREASGGEGASLSVASVQEAEQEVLGLIQSITGVDMSDVSLATIGIEDPSTIDAEDADLSVQSIALSAFSAAVAGLVDADDENQNTIQKALTNLTAVVSSGDNGLEVSGTDLAEVASAISESLGDIAEQYEAAGVENETTNNIEAAQSSTTQTITEGELIGDSPVVVPPPVVDPDSATPKVLASAFLDEFIDVLTVWTDTTGAEAGTTGIAPTEILFTELAAAETYGSAAATTAFDNLAHALIDAEATLEAGATVVNDDTDQDDLQFTLAKDEDGVVTMSNGWAMVMDSARSTRATVTITSGTYSRTPGVSGQLAMSGVDLLTEHVVDSVASQLQHFAGSVTADFGPDATDPGDLGLTTLAYDGTHFGTSTAGDSFNLSATLSNISGTALEDGGSGGNISGEYTVTLSFEGEQDIALNFNGTLRATSQNFWLRGGGNTIMGTVTVPGDSHLETTTLTDGTSTLTIVIDAGTQPMSLSSAVITVGDTEVATVDSDGVVTFSDDSIRYLPAGLL